MSAHPILSHLTGVLVIALIQHADIFVNSGMENVFL